MKFLRTMDHSMSMVFIEDDMHVVMRPDLPKKPARMAPVIVVKVGETDFQGSKVDRAGLVERLTAAHARLAEDIDMGRVPRRDPPDPKEINVVVDVAVPWSRVVEVTEDAAAAGFTRPAFAFGQPSPVAAPPHTWADDKLAELKKSDASNRASEVARVMTGIVKDCKALQREFGRVSATENEDKAAVIIEGTGPALIECGCNVDMPAFRTVMWLVAGNPQPTTVLHVDIAKGGKPIALAAATPWSEANKQLAEGAVVRFEVQP
jgi:hypothetical protein